jgi:Cu-Zn family superoxide dismutase
VDAVADLINTSGQSVGEAHFYKGSNGVVMRFSVSGIAPGIHGMHFHAKGTCEDPAEGFKATGGHIMPLGKPHGYMHPDGPHAGNLPNLIVGESGSATIELYSGLVTLDEGVAALLDEDGSTLIIHANEDDHLTQPIGGAGGRIVCGVVKRP